MKLIVKKRFRDKTDHATVYGPGTVLDVKDKERAADLVKRGLCAEYKGNKAAGAVLGEEAAELPAEGENAKGGSQERTAPDTTAPQSGTAPDTSSGSGTAPDTSSGSGAAADPAPETGRKTSRKDQ